MELQNAINVSNDILKNDDEDCITHISGLPDFNPTNLKLQKLKPSLAPANHLTSFSKLRLTQATTGTNTLHRDSQELKFNNPISQLILLNENGKGGGYSRQCLGGKITHAPE